jgi:hypothetical protein
MSTKEDAKKDEKKTSSSTTAKPAETLNADEAFARWKAQGGLLLVKTIAEELAAMVKAEVDAERAAEKERAAKMKAYFDALGGEPSLDDAEQGVAKRKRATRPAPTTDAEIVDCAVSYIKEKNAKNKPPEGRGVARATGHDAAKVEALLLGHADVFKGDDKRWHVHRPIQTSA